ncbi:MAG: ArsR/SmtB family transcription factor [Hyphomicrobium sp.]
MQGASTLFTGQSGIGSSGYIMDLEAMEARARRASTLLKAMGNSHRLMILCRLAEGEKCVGELERMIGLSQSALSQHLARLRRDDVVTTRRVAQTIYYSLSGPEARSIIATLYRLYCASDGVDFNGKSMSATESASPESNGATVG